LCYELEDGNAAEEVCYRKDMNFLPHLLNLLGKREVKAWACLKPVTIQGDRKRLALALREEVLALRGRIEKAWGRRFTTEQPPPRKRNASLTEPPLLPNQTGLRYFPYDARSPGG
jgi:hypothetical protein